MSAFERFAFGFPLPGLSYTPGEGEFLLVGKEGFRNQGPYVVLDDTGRKYLETVAGHGYIYRTGRARYAPTWLGWVAARPTLFDLLTNKN